ncbi:MAG TPA: hypothetical protein VGO53_16525 [Steroidobacteraceae bacterium]|jgi:hypothetical protein|nr:hypothetical protein [Steroidobacteraceae bacterium]
MTSRIAEADLKRVAAKAKKFLQGYMLTPPADDPDLVGSYHAVVAGVLTAHMQLYGWEIDVGALRYFGMDVPGDVPDDALIVAIGCDETGPRVKLLFTVCDHVRREKESPA